MIVVDKWRYDESFQNVSFIMQLWLGAMDVDLSESFVIYSYITYISSLAIQTSKHSEFSLTFSLNFIKNIVRVIF